MKEIDFSIKLGGAAGEGIFTTGNLISKFFQKLGQNVVFTQSYPSLIKGGHNTCAIKISNKKIFSEKIIHDILIEFDKIGFENDIKTLKKGGIIICDENIKIENQIQFEVIKLPFNEIKKELNYKYFNTYLFGICAGLFIKNEKIIEKIINKFFNKKSKEIIKENLKITLMGFNFINEKMKKSLFNLTNLNENYETNNLFLTGAEASVLGCIKAGVKFVAEYPMTPSTSFLTLMAKRSYDYNIITKHVEDEISAVNMVIGASFAGVRSMTATSGGGFALMSEAIGFSAMSETPLVIFECMRTGPSTGMPTYTEQGDLKFILNSSQGDFPIIVLAVGDLEESFFYSFEAFNLAEKYQTPIIVLLDKHINDTKLTVQKFNDKNLKINRGKLINLSDKKLEKYLRYEFTNDGISKRCLPSQDGGIHISSSYEHNESGWTCESGKNHELMMKKRFKKLENLNSDFLMPKLYGDKNANLTLIGWGSTKGAILDAIKELNELGYSVNYLHFIFLNPLPNKLKEVLNSLNDTMIIEGNYTGQLKSILREKFLFDIKKSYLKYDGRPFYYEDIIEKVKEVLEK